jgi:hypothetical protein
MKIITAISQPLVLAMLLSSCFLVACSRDSAPTNHSNPPPPVLDNGDGIVYKGPNPTSEDVQRFLVNLWSNIASDDRCGACHSEGGQAPQFVLRDNIDDAYNQALTVVDLQAPSLSRLVVKVAGGHNCWRAEASVCADTLTTWIEAWASAAGVSGNVIVLTPPEVKQVGSSLAYPVDSGEFATRIHTPYLLPYCSACHSPSGITPQQPYFADRDPSAAYEAAKSKMNLSAPARSRMVVRLREESHNCWSSSCQNDANLIEAAIAGFAGTIAPTEVNPNLITSNALQLGADGIVASSGGRVEPNIIAKYEFKTGSGDTAFDTSGQDPAMDLRLLGDVAWLEGGVAGLRFFGGRAQVLTATSEKLHKQITFTGEYSLEAWVTPANVTQEGPAPIVSYAGADDSRNFTLGQQLYSYDFANRTTDTDLAGAPSIATPNADEVLQSTLQHVVVTFNIIEGRRIYVNGELILSDDPGALGEGSLASWDDTFAFILGVKPSGADPWYGTMRFLAVHSRALSADSVAANFDVGVGEKFFLLFRVTDRLADGAIPSETDAYIVFEVEPFDSYSYLFAKPFFYLLDPNKTADSAPPVPLQTIEMAGMRIGVNGREATIGQAFANLDVTITASNYVAGEGFALADIGALIPVEQGKDSDEFFLTFDRLGGQSYDRPADVVPPASDSVDTDEANRSARIGIKTFAEINASFAQMTGVASTNPQVQDSFAKVIQQLPVDENIEGFLPAHHMGITQLAVTYCNALVADTTLRAARFSGFNFTQGANLAFDEAGRSIVIDNLVKALVVTTPAGDQLTSEPAVNAVADELNRLIDLMTACGPGCPASTTTTTTLTAVCAAALGSAAMLVQ